MEMVLTIVSIVLGFGAAGGVLLAMGVFKAEHNQSKKDTDGLGRKIEHVRKELKEDIKEVKNEHNQLESKVDEIAKTTVANNTLLSMMNVTLNRFLDAHAGDMR